nr:MAG TPA: hypothetical protein [Caudoviricetes sp.]
MHHFLVESVRRNWQLIGWVGKMHFIVKSTRFANKYLIIGSVIQKVMMISQKQILENGKEKLMFSQVDSPVNHSVWPDEERERKITVISGQSLNVPYEKSNRLGLLVRMLLESSQWYNPARRLIWKASLLREKREIKSENLSLKPSAKTSKQKDILSNRWLFRLVPSVRPIEETGSGLLPTITASDYRLRGPNSRQQGIGEYIRMNLLQTPTTVQHCESSENMKERSVKKEYRNGTIYNSLLSQLVYGGLLPTPQAVDSSIGAVIGRNDHFILTKNGTPRKVNQNGSNGSVGLARLFHLMNTPTATDWKGGSTRKQSSFQRTSLRGEIHADYGTGQTSQLNPLFVEEMMGFPTYWILMPFLKESAIPSEKVPTADGEPKL